jgi:hypothetical protein
LRCFDPASLSELLEARRCVRISLMRATIHLVSDRDCCAIRPVLQPWLERNLHTATPFGRALDGIDVAALTAAGRELLEEQPMMFSELGRRLAERFPGHDPTALGYAVREHLPLVQVTPRGLWGRSGRALHAPASQWLGRTMPATGDVGELVRRYLAAFGPATAADFGAWSGLPKARSLIPSDLPRFRDERGRELFDIPDGDRPHPDEPAPVRFLPDYDNVLLAHADRSRIFFDGALPRKVIGRPTVLIDGFVAGFWRLEPSGPLTITPVGRWSARNRRAVLTEAEALLELLGDRPVQLGCHP